MSNQEPQNQNKTAEEAGVEKRRRFIKGAAAATPVILTLASTSVFGQEECLSQQMSGNASGTTGSCVKGHLPAFWKDPVNRNSWPTGFDYGTALDNPASTTDCNRYSGGTTFNDPIAFGSGVGFISPTPTESIRVILCTSITSPAAIWSAALLNSVTIPSYILSKAQVLDLWNGGAAPIADKLLFLQSTMQ